MRVKIANSIAKIAELKTIAVTKVAVDAVWAAAALTSDLQTSQPMRHHKRGKTPTWDGRKEGRTIECGVSEAEPNSG